MATPISRLHARIRASSTLIVFTAMTRLLLAIGFLPSGFTKVMGRRFTLLGTDTPVGYFFEAFYQTGGWYRTVGWAQMVAAALLLFPPTAHLGAALFLPIIFNIWVITVAVGFKGTWVIASLMLLANLWLVAWDWDRWQPLLSPGPWRSTRPTPDFLPVMGAFALLAAGAFTLAVVAGVARLDRNPGWMGLPVFAIAGALFGAAVTMVARRIPPLPTA
jgi:hypothetical protein